MFWQVAPRLGLGDSTGATRAVRARARYGPGSDDRHRQAWREVYSHPIRGGPTTRGFDDILWHRRAQLAPYCFIENDRTLGIPTTFLPDELFRDHLASLPGPALVDWKLEDVLPAIAERACQYIGQRAKTDEPFFLYLPLTSPHTPLAVNEPWRGKSGLDSAVADFIMETDDVVGRVLAALAENGIEDDTLVVFTSDNGFAPVCGCQASRSPWALPERSATRLQG